MLMLLLLTPRSIQATESASPKATAADPHVLSGNALANLVAFTRAFGLIRFFHPSDDAASADWDELAVTGMAKLESARTTRELADALRAVFARVAPSAWFLAPGERAGRLAPPSHAAQVVRWRHHGFGFGQPPELGRIYFSEREHRPASPLPAAWRAPTEPLMFELGRGVTLALPLVVWADANGKTLPPAETTSQASAHAASAGSRNTARDRATRLAAVAVAWSAVRYFFPYFEEAGTDWDAQLTTTLGRAATDRTNADFLMTLRRMMAALRDGHAGAYLDEDVSGTAPSVALEIVEGQPVVAKAWGEAAAALPPGSVLLAIDGEVAASRMVQTAATVSASTPGLLDTRVAGELLVGAPGTALSVVARLPGGKVQEAALVRSPARGDGPPRPRPSPTREVRDGVWYVNLAKVSQADLEALYPKFADAKAIVFDLRSYPQVDPSFLQHLIDKPVTSTRWEVPVITGPGREAVAWDDPGRWLLNPVAPRIASKVAFLAGGGTMSYGESLLDIIDAYRLGVIVGATSAGTNGTAVETKLPGGFAITWTGMRVRRRDGAGLFGVGIPPNVRAAPTVAGLAADRDEVLDAAIREITR